MNNELRERARLIWRRLAARNQWHLITDEDALLDEILRRLQDGNGAQDARIVVHIKAIYSVRLYEGMRKREEQAANELWHLFTCIAHRRGEPSEDVAQEAMTKVLLKIHQVRDPTSFLAWAMMIERTTARDLGVVERKLLTVHHEEQFAEIADTADVFAHVEAQIIEETFRRLLQQVLPKPIERLILIRCVCLGEQPRDVAKHLQMKLEQVRLLKARAIQKLRADAAFMAFIASLKQEDDHV